jgi:PAS domain-containing protein
MTQERDFKNKTFDLRRRAESAFAEKPRDALDISTLSNEDVQKMVHELQVHQMELEMQNEELRRIQQDLETSRDKYSELYDFAPAGYLVLDQKGVILEANLTSFALLGRARAFLIGKPFASLVNEEDGNTLYLHFRQKFLLELLIMRCDHRRLGRLTVSLCSHE